MYIWELEINKYTLLDVFFSFDKNPSKAAKGDKNKLQKGDKEHPWDHKSSVKVGRAEEQNHASKICLWAKPGSDPAEEVPTSPSELQASPADSDLSALKIRNWEWPALLKIRWQTSQMKAVGISNCIWMPAFIFWPSLCWCSNTSPLERLKQKKKNILVRMKGRKSSEKGNDFEWEIPLHLSNSISYLQAFSASS